MPDEIHEEASKPPAEPTAGSFQFASARFHTLQEHHGNGRHRGKYGPEHAGPIRTGNIDTTEAGENHARDREDTHKFCSVYVLQLVVRQRWPSLCAEIILSSH